MGAGRAREVGVVTMTTTNILFAALCVLQVLDAYTTIKCIKSGKGREVNPVMRKLHDTVGLEAATVGFKVAAMLAIWYALPAAGQYDVHGLVALCALYAFVVVRNFKVLRG